MTKAHTTSGAWLDDSNHHLPHPERFLSLHDHRWARGPKDHQHTAAQPVAADLRERQRMTVRKTHVSIMEQAVGDGSALE